MSISIGLNSAYSKCMYIYVLKLLILSCLYSMLLALPTLSYVLWILALPIHYCQILNTFFFFLILSHTIHIPIILVILLIKPVYRKYLARAMLVCISRVNLEEHGAKVDTVR